MFSAHAENAVTGHVLGRQVQIIQIMAQADIEIMEIRHKSGFTCCDVYYDDRVDGAAETHLVLQLQMTPLAIGFSLLTTRT